MKALRFIIPAIVFAAIAWFLLAGLDRNPRDLPSQLKDKPAPDFSLPVTHDPARNWSPQDLRGRVWLLNVWGSWCAACRIEHPVWNELARSGEIPIVGLAWKDLPENSLDWLRRLGPPACFLSFLPVVGDPLCAVAGWLRLPLGACTVWMAAGKFARYLVMTAALLHVWPAGLP